MSWECRLNKTCILICIQSSALATSAGALTDHDDGQLSPWLLATHPISFVDGAEKTWRRAPEMYRFRCFSGFCAEKLEWQTVRMGVSCSKMENWVDESIWREVEFACWAGVLCPIGENGKSTTYRLFIIDPGASDYERRIYLRDLPEMQQKFIECCNEKKNIALVDVRVTRNEGGKPAATSLATVCGALYALLHDWRNWWPVKKTW